jgi:hypothetical protein
LKPDLFKSVRFAGVDCKKVISHSVAVEGGKNNPFQLGRKESCDAVLVQMLLVQKAFFWMNS